LIIAGYQFDFTCAQAVDYQHGMVCVHTQPKARVCKEQDIQTHMVTINGIGNPKQNAVVQPQHLLQPIGMESMYPKKIVSE
jgi:hypothetical protein